MCVCVIFSGCPYTILHQKDATDMAFIFLPVSTCNTDVSHQNHAALYSFFVKTAAVGFSTEWSLSPPAGGRGAVQQPEPAVIQDLCIQGAFSAK